MRAVRVTTGKHLDKATKRGLLLSWDGPRTSGTSFRYQRGLWDCMILALHPLIPRKPMHRETAKDWWGCRRSSIGTEPCPKSKMARKQYACYANWNIYFLSLSVKKQKKFSTGQFYRAHSTVYVEQSDFWERKMIMFCSGTPIMSVTLKSLCQW